MPSTFYSAQGKTGPAPPLPPVFSVGGSQHYGIWSQNFPNMYFDKGNAIVYQGVQKFQSTNTPGFATLFVLFVCYHCVITPPSATSRLLLKRIKPIFSQRILKIEISNTVVFAKVWPYCWLCITQRLLWPKSLFVTHSHHDHYVHTASRSLLFTTLSFQQWMLIWPPWSHSYCQHCQLFILMLSPVEWVVEHWKNSGQEVWIEGVEVIPDVLQDSEHYMQTEIGVLIFWSKGHFYAILVITWH